MVLFPSLRGARRRPLLYQLTQTGVQAIIIAQTGRRPAFQTHAQRQTFGSKHVLDFRQRLLAEVRRFQQFHLGALYQVTDVVNVLCLEAVGGTHRQLKVINRAQQDRIDFLTLLFLLRLALLLEIDKYSDLLLQDGRGTTDSFFRIDGAIGLEVNNQLVQVGALFDTGGLDYISDTANRAVAGVQLQTANGAGLVFFATTRIRCDITATLGHLELHTQLCVTIDGADNVIRIDQLNAVITLDIASGNNARAFLDQLQGCLATVFHAQGNALQVQQDVDHIFLNA